MLFPVISGHLWSTAGFPEIFVRSFFKGAVVSLCASGKGRSARCNAKQIEKERRRQPDESDSVHGAGSDRVSELQRHLRRGRTGAAVLQSAPTAYQRIFKQVYKCIIRSQGLFSAPPNAEALTARQKKCNIHSPVNLQVSNCITNRDFCGGPVFLLYCGTDVPRIIRIIFSPAD